MISAAVFATLNEAWDKFKADNNLQFYPSLSKGWKGNEPSLLVRVLGDLSFIASFSWDFANLPDNVSIAISNGDGESGSSEINITIPSIHLTFHTYACFLLVSLFYMSSISYPLIFSPRACNSSTTISQAIPPDLLST